MTRLPQVTGARLIRVLEGAGFSVKRQTGSHAIVVLRKDLSRRAIIPVHGSRSIRPGTLRSILAGLGLTVEELQQML